MSIDVAVRMYFPAASVAEVLACLADLTRHAGDRVLTIGPPEGGSYAIRHDDPDSAGGPPRPLKFGPGASLDMVLTYLTAVVRRKKRLPKGSKLQVDRWGDVVNFRVVKERVDYPVFLGLRRGREHIEVSIHNVASPDADFFDAAPFRAMLARLCAEGDAVAAAGIAMGEWYSFAEPARPIGTPAAWRDMEDEDELDIDAVAAQLRALL